MEIIKVCVCVCVRQGRGGEGGVMKKNPIIMKAIGRSFQTYIYVYILIMFMSVSTKII